MKKITKLFFFIAFFTLSFFASAQSFTIAELVDLAPNGEQYFSKTVTAKGYTYKQNVDNGLSESYSYNNSGNSKITLITPSFSNDVKMISWEFRSLASYNALKNELVASGYELTSTERRNGGKYESLFYSRPGIEVILTMDRTVDPNGIYLASVKYTNLSDYIVK